MCRLVPWGRTATLSTERSEAVMMPSESILRTELAISKASCAVKLPWTMAVMCVSRSSPGSDSCIQRATVTQV